MPWKTGKQKWGDFTFGPLFSRLGCSKITTSAISLAAPGSHLWPQSFLAPVEIAGLFGVTTGPTGPRHCMWAMMRWPRQNQKTIWGSCCGSWALRFKRKLCPLKWTESGPRELMFCRATPGVSRSDPPFWASPRYFWPEHAEQSPHSDQAPSSAHGHVICKTTVVWAWVWNNEKMKIFNILNQNSERGSRDRKKKKLPWCFRHCSWVIKWSTRWNTVGPQAPLTVHAMAVSAMEGVAGTYLRQFTWHVAIMILKLLAWEPIKVVAWNTTATCNP